MAAHPQPITHHFYPRPPRGGRRVRLSCKISGLVNFYPRPPRGGRQADDLQYLRQAKISIHALREEGDPKLTDKTLDCFISIHALREEGDPDDVVVYFFGHSISIHALREEGDPVQPESKGE